MSGQRRGPLAAVARGTLFCLSKPYAWAVGLRNRRYDSGGPAVVRLDRPVISVGNITTGGTGKTPLCIWLAERLLEMNKRPAVVSRGYGAEHADVSDEMQVLTRRVPRAICVAHPLRTAAAEFAIEEFGADIIVMDDGFQHRSLARDLDIVLIDATRPFGFDHLLPRGLLREPAKNLRRADLFVITHADQAAPDALRNTVDRLETLAPDTPVVRCRHAITGCVRPDGDIVTAAATRQMPVFLTAGIGNPHSFQQTVAALGANVVGTRWWPDHHHYDQANVRSLIEQARRCQAQTIFTTEKDLVKLQHLARDWSVPIAALRAEIVFVDDDDRSVRERLNQLLENFGARP